MYLKLRSEPYMTMTPSIYYNQLETHEFTTIALVCVSDGVSDYLSYNEIADIILDTTFEYTYDEPTCIHVEKPIITLQ